MIELAVELSQSVVDLAEETRLWVLIKLRAPHATGARRAPVNLSLVMDRSGSMAGDKLAFCQQAARFLVSHLSADDMFSLVAFDHEVQTPVHPTPVTQKEGVLRAILGLRPGGSTNLSGGWLQGASFAEQHTLQDGINRVVLLTDGLANAGVTEPASLIRMTGGLADKGITTTTIGCGTDFNEDLLRAMADAGRGNFHFIATPEDAPAIFHRELSELLAIYAQNLRLRVAPSQQVRQMMVMHDFPSEKRGREVDISLGDIFAGDEKVVLLEMGLGAGTPAREAGVSTVHLSYQQVLGDVALREVAAFVNVARGPSDNQTINPMVFKEVLLCQAAQELKQAVAEADLGNLEAARDRLDATTRKLETSSVAQDPQMEDQIQKLKGLKAQYEDNEKYRTVGRKTSTYMSHSTMRSKGRSGRTQTPELRALSRSRHVVFILGERLGVASGLVDPQEPFEGVPMDDLLRQESFDNDPVRVWRYFEHRMKKHQTAVPGHGHRVLSMLRHRWANVVFVSTATDTMLADIGVPDILYVNGRLWDAVCPVDHTVVDLRPLNGNLGLDKGNLPRCATCNAILRPSQPWTGEAVQAATQERLRHALRQAGGLVVVGTEHPGDGFSIDSLTLNVPTRLVVGTGVEDVHQALQDFEAALAAY
ncbi:MAG TPA: VWA domain-containing protein [Candidatus Xenobia bacterium]